MAAAEDTEQHDGRIEHQKVIDHGYKKDRDAGDDESPDYHRFPPPHPIHQGTEKGSKNGAR